MLSNYLKIGLRNIFKYRLFSFINLFSLALGMSVCMLIILMLEDQRDYDQFHERKSTTYRILSKSKPALKPNASSPFPLANTLEADYSFVDEATTLALGVGGDAVYNEKHMEARGFFAEPSFFEVFGFELKSGDRLTSLKEPNSIVLTAKLADLLFGDIDPIGKRLNFIDRNLDLIDLGNKESIATDWGSFTVTGVIADKDYKSHLRFDALISTSSMSGLEAENKLEPIRADWETYSRAFTYVVLNNGKNDADLTKALEQVVSKKYRHLEEFHNFKLLQQKLGSITPGIFVGNPTSLSLPIESYYFLSALAFAIVLSACLNYVFLSTARSLIRAKEIGVRKLVGAMKRSLIFQFLAESIIMSFLALVMAGILLFFLRLAFLNLWANQYLNFDLRPDASVLGWFVLLSLFIGILAGAYPAFRMSRFQPIGALRGFKIGRSAGFKFAMKKVLSASQFVISLFFIITSIIIFKQFQYFNEFKYEFTSQNIVDVPLQGNKFQLLYNEFSSVEGVEGASGCSFMPATGMAHGANIRRNSTDDEFTPAEIMQVDEHFFPHLALKIIAGNNLPQTGPVASDLVVVNEATVQAMGYSTPAEIIGQTLDRGGEQVHVVGVVQNFQFQTPMLSDRIGPLILNNDPEKFDFIVLKLSGNNPLSTISLLERRWKAIDPMHPFEYSFFDDELKNANRAIGDIVSIVGFISFIALVVACLGLLGMTTYAMERKEKEISIRKVHGAADSKILVLLSKEFLMLLAISILISAPLTYVFNTILLERIPNRIPVGFSTILLGCFVLFVFGCLTIASQTIRASRKKPVDSLRAE